MRVYTLLLCVISSALMNGNELQVIPKKYFDLIHTDLELRPLWKEHQMKGKATLTLIPYFHPQNKLILDIKYLDIHSVALKGSENKPLEYKFSKS